MRPFARRRAVGVRRPHARGADPCRRRGSEAKALPRAVPEARASATELAKLAGLTLGPIVSISDAPAPPYGPFLGSYGTFGPDRFCGTIRTPVFKRDNAGRRVRVGTRSGHGCRVPPRVTSSVTVTFAAG